jgi:hypothetical protein
MEAGALREDDMASNLINRKTGVPEVLVHTEDNTIQETPLMRRKAREELEVHHLQVPVPEATYHRL